MKHNFYSLLFIVMLSGSSLLAQSLEVALDGSAPYKKIQDAIDALPDSSDTPRMIILKKGVYNEKIYLNKANIILQGEERGTTIITASIARDEWRCDHPDDWGVATLNVGANDITLKNLTITNSYGFDSYERTIYCASDSSSTKMKTIRKDGHQMALRTMNMSTRLKAINCHFRSFGGDTVSPWEIYNGMWYFIDCIMEGGVDFYCPRGWAWAENCTFITHSGTAAIWHDGSGSYDSKTVLVNCRFSGFKGFQLGRYHRDAQFYLIDCQFDANMKDMPIYLVPTSNKILWGERVYFFNCRRDGGKDFPWYSNNLPVTVSRETINVNWVFGTRWNPEKID